MQKLFAQESIAVLIAGTRRSIKQYAWEKLRPWRVTPQQCGVLLVLFSEGGMSLGEVAGRIWCDNPTACRIVNKLVERGFVRSDSDAQDRRRFRLYLTDEGKALCNDLTLCANAVAQTLEQGLSEEDVMSLRRILSHVMSNAINATARPNKPSSISQTSASECGPQAEPDPDAGDDIDCNTAAEDGACPLTAEAPPSAKATTGLKSDDGTAQGTASASQISSPSPSPNKRMV